MTENETITPPPERLLTKADVATFCQVEVRTIDNWMKRGLLPYLKLGHYVRFQLDDVKAHIKNESRIVRKGVAR